jgi:hypothetical protein
MPEPETAETPPGLEGDVAEQIDALCRYRSGDGRGDYGGQLTLNIQRALMRLIDERIAAALEQGKP